jgi:hypothetical protein
MNQGKYEPTIIIFRDAIYEAAGGDKLTDEQWHRLKDAMIEFENKVLELSVE